MNTAASATFFDASALVKRYVDEPGSDALRRFWDTQPTKCTSPFCFYETLRVLKRYKIQKHPKLTKEQYLRAAGDLMDWFRESSSSAHDLDLTDHRAFRNAVDMAAFYDFDLSDAFQLLTLQAGGLGRIVLREPVGLLVTADEALAAAARKMQLRAWDCAREPAPGS